MVRRQKEKSKFGAYVIMAFMVFLMVGSLLGVILYAPQSYGDITYGEYTFLVDQNTGFYTTEVNGVTYQFNNLPYSVTGVAVDPAAIAKIQLAPLLIITFDPTLDETNLQYIDFVRFELASVMDNLGGGTTVEHEDFTLPIIDCQDATPEIPVLRADVGDPAITLEGNCIHFSGNQTTFILTKDALLYRLLGIVETDDAIEIV